MATKKLQIFVSSTYKDLIAERQAVVEAILMAGHIPAGMELFAAGDKSQLDTIRRWIKGSDVFMLILGGRYGSIEPESGKGYIQLEYEYALQENKPVFAAVNSERYLDAKVKAEGKGALELEHPDLYEAFRKDVLGRICRFFDDAKDLKLIVHESIPTVTRDRVLSGWIPGDEVVDPKQVLQDMSSLQAENKRLLKSVTELEKRISSDTYNGFSFDELVQILEKEQLSIEKLSATGGRRKVSLLDLFVSFADAFAVGLANTVGMNDANKFAFFELAPKLLIYGLVEKKSVGSHGVQRIQTSALGNRFLGKIKSTFSFGPPPEVKGGEPQTSVTTKSPRKASDKK